MEEAGGLGAKGVGALVEEGGYTAVVCVECQGRILNILNYFFQSQFQWILRLLKKQNSHCSRIPRNSSAFGITFICKK